MRSPIARPASLIPACLALTLGAAQAQEVIDADAHFPEGPVVIDGDLYYVEYAANTLMRWDGSEVTQVWSQEGCGPSAVLPFADDLLITCYDAGTVARVSLAGETVAEITEDANGAPIVGPNDFAADGAGGVWMTASGPWASEPIAGVVYHIGAGMDARPVADDLHYANGIAQIGDTLYVAESEAARIVAFDIAPDGTLSNRRLFVRLGQVDESLGPWAYPDGIEVSPDGHLWIGSYATGRLIALDTEGALVDARDVDGATAPNLAFGGDGTIYVMTVDQTDAAPYAGRVLALSE